ncbi:MAG TPA: PAS domain-containing protein [Thermoanaerobaculia bacterium]|nr:PAS domain-containing protein [Thermoanaerobaculia bacterium]
MAAAPTEDSRFSLLVQFSRELSDSLDFREILESLARFIVPTLADCCTLDVFHEDGSVERAVALHRDPEGQGVLDELCRLYPPRVGSSALSGKVLRTGEPVLLSEVTEEDLRASSRDQGHFELIRKIGPKSSILLPLVARGRVLGSVAFSVLSGDRRYGPDDLVLAEELGYRAALALDNARLYSQAQESARRLTENAALLDALVAGAPVGISFLDRDLRYLRMNDVMARLNGTDPLAVLGRNLREVVPGVADRVEPFYRRVLETGEPVVNLEVSGETPAAPGMRRHFLANYYPIRAAEKGPPVGVGAAVVEITARKRAEDTLQEINQTLQALIRASPLAIMVLEPLDGSVRLWNPAAERIFGWAEAEVLGRPLPAVPEERREKFRENLARSLSGEMYAGFETYGFRKDGSRVEVSLWTSAVPDSAGVVRVMILAADIGERKRLEAELERRVDELAEADQRKDEFLAMLAHELRNPLAAISNAGHVLGARPSRDPRSEELLAVIGRQIRHLSRLVDDLLDVSRFTHGRIALRKRRIELKPVVAGAVETARPLLEARSHDLAVSLPGEPLWIEADATRIEQVLANLLANAAKFTDPGGSIRLTAERQGGQAAIRVRDLGAGIPAELLPRVFDLFVQGERSLDRSHGGLGIGLTLVRSLVERHGGTVSAASEGPGRGSEFTVLLPLAAPAAEAEPTAPEKAEGAPRTSCILLVEDNQDAAAALAELLGIWGHQVRVAYDGPAALEAAKASPPEMVLLDIGLPGMDGYEVARLLRGLPGLARATIVALTGYGQESDRRRSELAGIDHHLVKPVDVEHLRRLVGEVRANLLQEK